MTDEAASAGRLAPLLDAGELSEFLAAAFPAAAAAGSLPSIEKVGSGRLRLRLDPGPETLRPGGIVAGPTLMSLADTAAYAVIIAHIGRQPMAVTHSLSISFLRPCRPTSITVDAELLRLGRRLATVEVKIWQTAPDQPTAHATVGYALP